MSTTYSAPAYHSTTGNLGLFGFTCFNSGACVVKCEFNGSNAWPNFFSLSCVTKRVFSLSNDYT